MATKEYEMTIKLIGNKNPCHSGHKVGEEWIFDFKPCLHKVPGQSCLLKDSGGVSKGLNIPPAHNLDL